jgi:hypothetical protein
MDMDHDAFWPSSIVDELANRRAVFVLGAGASAASQGNGGATPPSWEQLIRELSSKLKVAEDQSLVSTLIDARQYLDAAQIIRDQIPPADFSNIIRGKLEAPNFHASKVHELIYEIDPKVVITTNYDRIYEKFCDASSGDRGYNVCKYYESHALNDLRSNIRCIMKIHGCVTDPTKIVLDRNSYFSARRDHSQFFRILDGVFLTSTLIFVGCSLDDPDLQLLLENANIAAPCEHSHWALMQSGQHPSKLASFSKNFNIRVLEYSDPTHAEVASKLEVLRDLVLDRRSTTF